MTAVEDDLILTILISIAAAWYYKARAPLYRERNFPIHTPERKFKPSRKKIALESDTAHTKERVNADIRVIRIASDGYAPNPITADEWVDIVEGDPDLETVSELDPFPVKLRLATRNDAALFTFEGGSIVAHNPTSTEISKKREIAERLNAVVLGCNARAIDKDGNVKYPTGQYPCELPSGATYYYHAIDNKN